MRFALAVAFCVVMLLVASPLLAEVGDPTIETDHPQYAGEGAFQSIEDCVKFATAGKESTQDRAIAMYLWLLEHQYHLASPQEWCVPGRRPDNVGGSDDAMIPFDANRARFSYGYGLCGTVHAWNEPYWNALDMRPRRRAFPGHVNSEILYDDAWHAFDTDMAGLLFRKDGVVAGYDDLIRDPGLVDSVKPPLPHYPFAWPGDFDTMKRGWQEIAAGGDWYSLYNGGYAAHPGIVRLRSGETFTRWFDRDHYGGPLQRRFWHHLAGGPQRNWTYVNSSGPLHRGETSNSRGNASYCNGEFVFVPDLGSQRCREGAVHIGLNVAHRAASPKLFSRDGERATITFEHFSPYVICGDPEDDANPMSGPATGGLVVEGSSVGSVRATVSVDQGRSWQGVALHNADSSGVGTGHFRVDLTESVKGRYGWQLRFAWSGADGLDDLRFTTVTQVSQAIYPRLKPNGSRVTYRSASRGVVPVLPSFGTDEAADAAVEERSLRSPNVEYVGRGPQSPYAFRTTDNKPGSVVFRVDAPSELLEVRAAIRYQLRVPPPADAAYRLEVSTDAGKNWREFARSDIPTDNEFSSGWLAGTVDLANAKTRSALLRATMYAGGHRTGLMDVQLYGVYRTAAPQNLRIEYGWGEAGESRKHAVDVAAGRTEYEFDVPTGATIVDEFVRLSVP